MAFGLEVCRLKLDFFLLNQKNWLELDHGQGGDASERRRDDALQKQPPVSIESKV